MSFTVGWHVLYVKSRLEKRVNESLKEISLESFLPQVKTIKQWSDRKKTVLKPLFPSYVFVYINSSLELHKALSVNGVCAYIKFGREYAKVKEEEIKKIKLLVETDEVSNVQTISEYPKIGAWKKITYGTLRGLECEVLKIKGGNKIIVRIDSLHQNITATVPLDFLN